MTNDPVRPITPPGLTEEIKSGGGSGVGIGGIGVGGGSGVGVG